MPFDTMTAARPYMRERTETLAALVATNPADDIIRTVAAELEHRTRPSARRLLAELQNRLTGRAVAVIVQEPRPEPVSEPVAPRPAAIVEQHDNGEVTVRSAPSKPRQAPKATKRAMGQSREENQAARRAHFSLLCKAQDAAEREYGRASDGQSVWAGVPGAAHMVRVPAELGVYVTLAGKAQREPRDRVYPAPRFWPGGALPEGYEDLGPHQPRVAFKAQPGSAEWRKWVEVQNRVMKPDDNSAMANRAFNVMHDKPRRRRAA